MLLIDNNIIIYEWNDTMKKLIVLFGFAFLGFFQNSYANDSKLDCGHVEIRFSLGRDNYLLPKNVHITPVAVYSAQSYKWNPVEPDVYERYLYIEQKEFLRGTEGISALVEYYDTDRKNVFKFMVNQGFCALQAGKLTVDQCKLNGKPVLCTDIISWINQPYYEMFHRSTPGLVLIIYNPNPRSF